MKLRDIFTEAFWKARWKDTIEGFAAYGRAVGGMPPVDTQPPQPAAPAPEKKPQPPGGPG